MLSILCTLKMFMDQVAFRLRQRLATESGASTVEWVVITGFLIILAAVVGRAVYTLVSDASGKLEVPHIP